MATVAEVSNLYRTVLGREPDAAGLDFWVNSGQSLSNIQSIFNQSPEAQVVKIYQQQLGRAPDAEGLAFYSNALASGSSIADITRGINTSLEGQNFDTQLLTSVYRQELGRNPEQEGFQFWKSAAQDAGLTADQLRQTVIDAAVKEQLERNITGGFTQMELAALEADPFGGRYATRSIYDLPTDAANVSTIGNRQAQFVAPVTQRPVVSQFGDNRAFAATPGQEVLSNPAVLSALERSLNSGALDQAGYNTIVSGLTTATNMEELRNVLSTPKAQVIIDAIYGQQTGEDVDLATALAEAAQRQAVLDANDTGYYQNNFNLADAYNAAGLESPFTREGMQGPDTQMNQGNVVTPQNFNNRLNALLESITGQFGGNNQVQTQQSPQYYSESGLQSGFTPFGTEGTTFRSGVAGYIPQSQLPTGFQFGAPPVDASFQQYRPGAFQPPGVTTGGFITGYNANGTPIYSTYSNPNVNVGGNLSALNAYTPTDANAIANMQAQIDAMNAAAANNQNATGA